MSIVAISETAGSLGIEIGRKLAESLGWEFVDRAWRPGFPGRGELLSKKELIDDYLLSRLERSAYWPDLKEIQSAELNK